MKLKVPLFHIDDNVADSKALATWIASEFTDELQLHPSPSDTVELRGVHFYKGDVGAHWNNVISAAKAPFIVLLDLKLDQAEGSGIQGDRLLRELKGDAAKRPVATIIISSAAQRGEVEDLVRLDNRQEGFWVKDGPTLAASNENRNRLRRDIEEALLFLRGDVMRYWCSVWAMSGSSLGHEYANAPGSVFKDACGDERGFKSVFCWRNDAAFRREESGYRHCWDGLDSVSLAAAAKLLEVSLRNVGRATVTVGSGDGSTRINWPTNPGATFLWRFSRFVKELDSYEGQLSIGLSEGRDAIVDVPIRESWRFWNAVLTRKGDGASVGALRDLVGGRVPQASEIVDPACPADGRERIVALRNKNVNEGKNPILPAYCRPEWTPEGIRLSWGYVCRRGD